MVRFSSGIILESTKEWVGMDNKKLLEDLKIHLNSLEQQLADKKNCQKEIKDVKKILDTASNFLDRQPSFIGEKNFRDPHIGVIYFVLTNMNGVITKLGKELKSLQTVQGPTGNYYSTFAMDELKVKAPRIELRNGLLKIVAIIYENRPHIKDKEELLKSKEEEILKVSAAKPERK